MISLANEHLSVELLDPVADRARFGSRYCTGGYIFQITDARRGPLLSGPTFPDAFDWFNGQGIPDSFAAAPLRESASSGPTALIVGIGLCDLSTRQVLRFDDWTVQATGTSAAFRMTQSLGPFSLTLERTVTLERRSVRSVTSLINTGDEQIPVQWFPHPFMPQPDDPELCRFTFETRIPPNPGFHLADNGFVVRSAWPDPAGFDQPVEHGATERVSVLQRHPLLGMIGASYSYVPGLLHLWGNDRTFSWEPYLERTVGVECLLTWSAEYHF